MVVLSYLSGFQTDTLEGYQNDTKTIPVCDISSCWKTVAKDWVEEPNFNITKSACNLKNDRVHNKETIPPMAMIFSLHKRVFNSAHMVAPLACDPLKPWSSLQVTARRLQESVPKQAVTPEAGADVFFELIGHLQRWQEVQGFNGKFQEILRRKSNAGWKMVRVEKKTRWWKWSWQVCNARNPRQYYCSFDADCKSDCKAKPVKPWLRCSCGSCRELTNNMFGTVLRSIIVFADGPRGETRCS